MRCGVRVGRKFLRRAEREVRRARERDGTDRPTEKTSETPRRTRRGNRPSPDPATSGPFTFIPHPNSSTVLRSLYRPRPGPVPQRRLRTTPWLGRDRDGFSRPRASLTGVVGVDGTPRQFFFITISVGDRVPGPTRVRLR